MSRIEEKLSKQFYDWELYGRGWHIWDYPVSVEPAFRQFQRQQTFAQEIVDDGRRPTFLSSMLSRWTGGQEVASAPLAEEILEPDRFERENIVEWQASLPITLTIGKDNIEQFLFCLGHFNAPISFEILGTPNVVSIQFAASSVDADNLGQQLQAHFSEAFFTRRSGVLQEVWTQNTSPESLVFQFGLAREFMFSILSARSFNIDPLIGMVGAVSSLRPAELGLFQVIFERLRNPWARSILDAVTDQTGKDFFINVPELASEAKLKVAKPLYAAVLRIGVRGETFERTLELARNMARALSIFSNPRGNEFVPLENSAYPHLQHEEDLLRRQSRRSGMILNSDELISLVHLPSSTVRTPKLKRETTKTKSAPEITRHSSGILLGQNTHAGNVTEVRLSPDQRIRHTYVVGASGTGKSTFLKTLISQDIENGEGVAVFDPHGDLIEGLIRAIPNHRIADVVLLDPSDEDYSVGFNILKAHTDLEKNLLASDLVSIFERLSTSWGDQMGSVLNNAFRAFLESREGGTLADLRRFLIEPDFRNSFLETVADSDVVYYWRKVFPLLTGNKSIGPVLTRLDTFLGPKPIRYMVSQKHNRLDFSDIMNSGKIFLAKLSQGTMGKENSYLMGSFLVAKLHQAAMSRTTVSERSRRNFWVYIDEFQNFITPSMAEILSGARKYHIGLILAHQELRQLQRDSDVASAVLSQPYTRVTFRVGDDDAKKLSDGYSFFTAKELQSLSNFEALCRVERSDFDFNLTPVIPDDSLDFPGDERAKEVVAASRQKYAVPRSKLESELSPQSGAKRPEVEKLNQEDSKPKDEKASTCFRENSKLEQLAKPDLVGPEREIQKTALPSLPEVAAREKKTTSQPELSGKGIGGNQHNLIRERIESAAREMGFTASREEYTPQGQKIDLVLKRADLSIACEIAITTTIDHEVGNVAKCLKAGFDQVAMISSSQDRLRNIQTAVEAAISKDGLSSVRYFLIEDFLRHIHEMQEQKPVPRATSFGKYTVKRTIRELTPEEVKDREAVALRVIAESMRNKGTP